MSENIRGITFAEQTVTPADDAIVRRAILPDGILTGCEISYSGSTLTMAGGYLIACGRAFQITAAQNWAVVDATSGVARLLLTIDLTKTATEDVFNQIEFSIEYASAADGFADLSQEDINLAGTRYQIAAAVVSLGTGGITGILSKMEKSEAGGGLNFKVVGGRTQPANPADNMIWVNTDVKITSWCFSAMEPTAPVEGMVWIFTGTSSNIEFNALKKNGVQVYPQYAKQYIGGAWVDKVAEIWQGGEWVNLWNGILYEAGNEFEAYTGGWSSNGWTITGTTGNVYESADGTKGEDYLQIQYSSNSTCYMLGTQNKVDFTGYSTLEVECERISGAEMYVVTPQEKAVTVTKTTPSVAMSASGVATLDISTVGSAYIALVPRLAASEIPKWKIMKVRLLR